MEGYIRLQFDDGPNGPNADYFMCRRCQTHIALRQDFVSVYWFPPVRGAFYGGLFNIANNVREDEVVGHLQLNENTLNRLWLSPIYCLHCDAYLGYRYIWLHPLAQRNFRNGMVLLYMVSLSRSRGGEVLSGDELLHSIVQNDIEDQHTYSFLIRAVDPSAQ